jgi:hypothetical protein
MSENTRTAMASPQLSLRDLLGKRYTDAICEARACVEGSDRHALAAIAEEKVDFAPEWYQRRIDDLIDHIGKQVCSGLPRSAQGAGTTSFKNATQIEAAPLTGLERVAERTWYPKANTIMPP